MAKPETPTNEQPKEDGLFEELPKKPQAIIKVTPIVVDSEFVEPEGWILKEIHSVDGTNGGFYGVLVKIQEDPNARKKSNISKPVNLS